MGASKCDDDCPATTALDSGGGLAGDGAGSRVVAPVGAEQGGSGLASGSRGGGEVHNGLVYGCQHLRVFRLLHLLINKLSGHVHHSNDSHLPWVEISKVFICRLVPMLLATIVDSRGTIRTNARIVAKVHWRMLQDRPNDGAAKTSRRDTAKATDFRLTGRRMRTLRRQPHSSGR
ncbi:hypothetical protein E2562_011734 [Oryza meyeriana var. granulata]|uniref:Uncharacterized protein n=1 Tax=Oryza meyeriana var. granulata TaxID=110450 RepID=A0A6G1DGJ2_9ORYZ|nr:hypothetical protein E2562_011734 [Oryza meyeriana var. granulata]